MGANTELREKAAVIAGEAMRSAPDVAQTGTGAVVVHLSDVVAEPVTWLWPARLPKGKLTVLDGDPSVGKSTLMLDVAAHVTTGTPWPDKADCPVGHVLILSAEDGLADTIRPRLDAAGADPTKVHALTEVRYLDDEGELRARAVTLADIGPIEEAVVRFGAALVVVDVLMAYLPGRVDSHRDQDVRTVLAAVAAMAERTGACVVLIRHLNKAPGGNPLYRGGGSIGIIGAARAAMLAAVDPDDENRRVLAVTKSNLAPAPPALAYRLTDTGQGCARVEWLGTTDHRPADLLVRLEDDDERTERDEAVEWLVDYLSANGGTASAGDAIKAATANGIAKRTLQRARSRAGVTSRKAGLAGGWLWQLEGRCHEDAEGARSQGLASTAPLVTPSEPSPPAFYNRDEF